MKVKADVIYLRVLSPAIVLVLMAGIVSVVALRRARPEDIPAIVRAIMSAIRRLGETLPTSRAQRDNTRANAGSGDPVGELPGEGTTEAAGEVSDTTPQ